MYRFPLSKLCKRRNNNAAVLLSCGSFNPVTNMHLRLLELSVDYLESIGVQVLGGYLSPVNDGYKKKGLLPSHHRVNMLNLAVQGSNLIMVDDWEATRPQWQTTLSIIEHVYQEINTHATDGNFSEKVQVYFVCGADLFESFYQPNLWEIDDIDKITKHGVIVVDRGNVPVQKLIYEHDTLYKNNKNIHPLRPRHLDDISSTLVRLEIKRNKSIKYLTPDPVVEYIKEHNLYKDQSKL